MSSAGRIVWMVQGLVLAASGMQLARAEEATAARDESRLEVTIFQDDIPTEPFEEAGAAVFRIPGPINPRPFPSQAEVTKLFAAAGLEGFVKGWDPLDRDLYVATARTRRLEELVAAFPMIPKEKSARFQELLAKPATK